MNVHKHLAATEEVPLVVVHDERTRGPPVRGRVVGQEEVTAPVPEDTHGVSEDFESSWGRRTNEQDVDVSLALIGEPVPPLRPPELEMLRRNPRVPKCSNGEPVDVE